MADSDNYQEGKPQTTGGGTKDAGQAPVDYQGSPSLDFSAFKEIKPADEGQKPKNLDFILDIPLEITVELGRTKMLIHDLLRLGQGSVIELTKPAGETLEILANNRLIAKGDVVVINDKYGIRLTEVISPVERLEKLK